MGVAVNEEGGEGWVLVDAMDDESRVDLAEDLGAVAEFQHGENGAHFPRFRGKPFYF